MIKTKFFQMTLRKSTTHRRRKQARSAKTKKAARAVFRGERHAKGRRPSKKVRKPSKRTKISRKQLKLKFKKPARKPKAKVFVEPEIITPPTEEQVWHLVQKGRGRGFLTEVEILSLFPRAEHYLDLYEAFLNLIDKNGV